MKIYSGNSCCFCISLKTGAWVIAALFMIRSGITIATCAIGWLVGVYGSLLKWAPKIHVVLIILLKRATLYDLQKSLKDAITEDKIIVMVKGMRNGLMAVLLVEVVYLIFTIVLCIAIYKKNPLWMSCWLCLEASRVLFEYGYGFGLLISGIRMCVGLSFYEGSVGSHVAYFSSMLLSIGMVSYFLFIVGAYMNKIKQDDSSVSPSDDDDTS